MPEATWNTANEKEYINKLIAGTYRPNHMGRNENHDPERLLKNYIRSAKRREYWGTFDRVGVNADVVIKYAEAYLAAIRQETRKEGGAT